MTDNYMREDSITKQEVDLEDSLHDLSSQSNSGEKLLHSDLNCFKFVEHMNSDKDFASNQEEGTFTLDKPQYYDYASQHHNNDNPNLFVCGLIRDIDHVQKQKNKKDQLKSSRINAKNTSLRNNLTSRSNSFSQIGTKSPNANKNREYESVKSQKDFLQLFTTQDPSQFLFYSKDMMSANLINAILNEKEDIQGFIQTFSNSFNEKDKKSQNLKAFQFDLCLNENQGHSLKDNREMQNWVFIKQRASESHSRLSSPSNYTNLDQEPNHLVFIFGQQKANKQSLISLLEKDSLINMYLASLSEPIRFMKVQLFYLDKEYVLGQKSYTTQSQNQREFGMEMRQAIRNKDIVIKKIAQGHKAVSHNLISEIKNGCHLAIQINHHIFVDLAGIEGLNSTTNPSLVQSLTNNFSSMTNEILKLSPIYQQHNFQITKDMESSMLHSFLKTNISRDSKILLLCCVSPCKEHLAQSQIALDYCQKIKCYFNGIFQDEMLNNTFSINEATLNVEHQKRVSQIGKYFQTLNKVKQQIDKAYNCGITSKIKYNNLLSKLEKIKSNLLNENQRFDSGQEDSKQNHLARIQQQLIYEIESVQVQIQTMKDLQNVGVGDLSSRTPNYSRRSSSQVRTRSHSQKRITFQSFDQTKKPTNTTAAKSQQKSVGNKNKNTRSNEQNQITNSSKQSVRKTQNQLDNMLESNKKQEIELISQGLHQCSRETPAFVPDQHLQSSLYLKTSQGSKHHNYLDSQYKISALNSQFTSLNQGSLYQNTERSAEKKVHNILQEDNNQSQVSGMDKSFSIMQEKLKDALTENENLTNLKEIYESKIKALQDHLRNNSQISEYDSQKDKIVSELENRVKDQSKMIESLEHQNKCLQNNTNKAIKKSDGQSDSINSIRVKELEKQLKQKYIEVEVLKREKDEAKDDNSLIINQICQMKVVIEEFKESEKESTDIVEKIGRRDKKIKQLEAQVIELSKKQEQSMKDQSELITKTKQQEEIISKKKQENEVLNKQQQTRLEEVENKFESVYNDFKTQVEMNKELQTNLDKKDMQVRQLEKAIENYKDQTIDLKQEIKITKQKLNTQDENLVNMKHEINQKQKSMVLCDIKNLIKDYKNEKKGTSNSSTGIVNKY